MCLCVCCRRTPNQNKELFKEHFTIFNVLLLKVKRLNRFSSGKVVVSHLNGICEEASMVVSIKYIAFMTEPKFIT